MGCAGIARGQCLRVWRTDIARKRHLPLQKNLPRLEELTGEYGLSSRRIKIKQSERINVIVHVIPYIKKALRQL
jgi:hypothetical protein